MGEEITLTIIQVYAPTVLNSIVLPILTYRMQSWALPIKLKKKLESTQFAMVFSILGIKLRNKIKKIDLVGRTALRDINYTAKKLKFNYAGHMCRGNTEKWNAVTVS